MVIVILVGLVVVAYSKVLFLKSIVWLLPLIMTLAPFARLPNEPVVGAVKLAVMSI
ncbi:hypothetical protein AB3K25_02715 [Leuconostoc sp. MS02]|uniref:Uncharacterized protein n=1 Tax=Leuconostoc aquikimchii TaxID=3236804 RepID=A0ABV3S3Z5_9LACO